MSYPPHLPPPVCNIASHRRWEKVKIILIASFFGLFAGVTGGAIALGWIWPATGGADNWVAVKTVSEVARHQLEEKAKTGASETIYTLYRRETAVTGAGLLSDVDRLGEAVMLSSDGWAVTYQPGFNGQYRDWRAVGFRGEMYKIDKTIFDARTNFVFMKLSLLKSVPVGTTREQFKIAVLAEQPKMRDEVYVSEDNLWQGALVLGINYSSGEAHLDSASVGAVRLSASFRSGTLAANGEGKIVGFIGTTGELVPIFSAASGLNLIQTKGRVVYRSLGVEGWYDSEKPIVLNGERVSGFYVSRSVSTKSILKRGDVIVEINGRSMNSDNLWYNINQENVALKVWRVGGIKPVDLTANILEI